MGKLSNEDLNQDIALFQAIWHFLYWIDFEHLKANIEWDNHLKNHLIDKLQGYINREDTGCIAVQALVHWIQDISTDNQKSLLDYIKKYHWDKW